MIEIDDVMSTLAQERPVFHSEADFQHALAWCIRTTNPDLRVRLEYQPFQSRPIREKRVYLDLWLPDIGVAVELKYYTRKLEFEHNGESFALRHHAAYPLRRYDFLKDVQRLERVCGERGIAQAGFAVLLTNDPLYWTRPARDDIVDAAFRLHDGRQVSKEKELDWSKDASDGTKKGREKSICLARSYGLLWRDYEEFDSVRYGQFRYLAVQVLC